MSLFPPSLDDQIACVEREIALRKKAYPRWIRMRRMTDKRAADEIDTMTAVLATLRAVKTNGG